MHHLRTVRELRAGSWKPEISRNGIALGLLLAVVGAGISVYLLLLH
jgi:hypothetical protein